MRWGEGDIEVGRGGHYGGERGTLWWGGRERGTLRWGEGDIVVGREGHR